MNFVLSAFLRLPPKSVLDAFNMAINCVIAVMIPHAGFVLGLTSPLHAPVGPLMALLMTRMVVGPMAASPNDLPLFFCTGAWCGPWESPFVAPSIEYAVFELLLASHSL